jgi:hypothetical protein
VGFQDTKGLTRTLQRLKAERSIMGLYQKFVLPRLIDVAMRNKEVAARRAEPIPKASGVVLEIGIGSGLNLPFFPGTITRLAGVDPSAELLSMARPKLGGVSFPVELFCRPRRTSHLTTGASTPPF